MEAASTQNQSSTQVMLEALQEIVRSEDGYCCESDDSGVSRMHGMAQIARDALAKARRSDQYTAEELERRWGQLP